MGTTTISKGSYNAAVPDDNDPVRLGAQRIRELATRLLSYHQTDGAYSAAIKTRVDAAHEATTTRIWSGGTTTADIATGAERPVVALSLPAAAPAGLYIVTCRMTFLARTPLVAWTGVKRSAAKLSTTESNHSDGFFAATHVGFYNRRPGDGTQSFTGWINHNSGVAVQRQNFSTLDIALVLPYV